MYVCMYVCICVCMYVCMYVCVYVCTVCVYVHITAIYGRNRRELKVFTNNNDLSN